MLGHLLVGDGVPRRARKLLAKGQPAQARITGIRVEDFAEGHDRWRYALEVQAGPGGSFRVGVRQTLAPQRERAHLGAVLVVRHDDRHAVIDWTGSMAAWGRSGVPPSASGWDAVEPPPDGIDDRREAYRPASAGAPVTAELSAVARATGAAATLGGWALELTVDGARSSHPHVQVPAYAVHLLVPGTHLPAAVEHGRVRIDWPRAAVQARPAGAFDFDALTDEGARPDESIGDMDGWLAEFDAWRR